MDLQEALVKFKELTNKHGTDLITYDWDDGHVYSALKVYPIYSLYSGVEKLSEKEQCIFDEIVGEWMYCNEELPYCVPGGGCGCIDMSDVDTVKEFIREYEEIKGVGKVSKHHNHVSEFIAKLELDEAVDSELAA